MESKGSLHLCFDCDSIFYMEKIHLIQEKLLDLAKRQNLADISLRQMAREIGMPNESPQKIKHHLSQLQKKGFLSLGNVKGVMQKVNYEPTWAKGLLKKAQSLFSIPIIGTANCGPAEIFAEHNFQGFLKVSSKLVGQSKPTGLFAIKTDGYSMNQAEINGRKIDDGDFVIVNREDKTVETNDIVLVIVDNKATIKRFINDKENEQVVLKADSSFDYEPIYLHPDDDFSISGKVISVIKKPKK